jgi:hypothetical protein
MYNASKWTLLFLALKEGLAFRSKLRGLSMVVVLGKLLLLQ